MKRNLAIFAVVALFLAWFGVMAVHVGAQEKKGLRFYTYDSSASGKALCFDTDGKSLVTCASLTVAGGLNSSGTVTGNRLASSGTFTVNGVLCFKAGGLVSYCTTSIAANGTCTCN